MHHRRLILMQKMQNFSGEGSGEGHSPLPQWGPPPHTQPPRRLDLNPSHSEILPTLLTDRQTGGQNCYTNISRVSVRTRDKNEKKPYFRPAILRS